MPIYEYHCSNCETNFEAIRRISEADDPIACKHCQSDKTSRGITAAYARSEGGSVAGSDSSCSDCSGGTCSSCGCH